MNVHVKPEESALPMKVHVCSLKATEMKNSNAANA
jgi:hypothetical protein